MDTIKAINSRCSMRRYVEDFQIPEEDVKTILECAMKAPSAMNTRPWKFIVITNKEVLNKIAEVHQYAKFLPNGFFSYYCGRFTRSSRE